MGYGGIWGDMEPMERAGARAHMGPTGALRAQMYPSLRINFELIVQSIVAVPSATVKPWRQRRTSGNVPPILGQRPLMTQLIRVSEARKTRVADESNVERLEPGVRCTLPRTSNVRIFTGRTM